MNQLIVLINELQNVFATVGLDDLELPQIVVLGSQSSGKSSVLEGIVGKHFLPRGTGIVTRRPLVLQLESTKKKNLSKDFLIHSKKLKEALSDSENKEDVEFGVFHHKKDEIFEDYRDIEREITEETNRVAGSGKMISPDPIILKIYSPHVIDLTLVDLPGLTKIPIKDQPEDIEKQISELVLKYVQNPNSIILVITPGNVDIATSEAIKLAKQVDPLGKRTITVITKLDIMDKGTNAMDILSGEVINANLGIIGVVNRSQMDVEMHKSVEEALESERNFFLKNYPLVALNHGIGVLTRTLNKILMEHIKKCLPELKLRINTLKKKFQSIAEFCGNEIKDKNQLVLYLLTKFANCYCDVIRGTTRNMVTDELCGGARIYYIFYEIFVKRVFSMDPLDGLSKDDVLTAIRNAMGSKPYLFVPEISFEVLIQKQIIKLEDPSLSCVNLVHEEMQRAIKTSLKLCSEITNFPNLHTHLVEVMTSILSTELTPTIEMVKNLVRMEMAFINTNHPDFVSVAQMTAKMLRDSGLTLFSTHDEKVEENLVAKMSELNVNNKIEPAVSPKKSRTKNKKNNEYSNSNKDDMNAQLIEVLIKSYMNLVKIKFQDSVPKAISCFLINKVLDEVPSILIRQLYKESLIDLLLQESENVTELRKNAVEMLDALNQASKVIRDIKDP